MNKKNEIAPEDKNIYDITKRGKPKKSSIEVKDTLDNKTVDEKLLETVKKIEGERRLINLPLDVKNQLDTSNGLTEWEALQVYFIRTYSERILDHATWEINQAILKEPEPIIEPHRRTNVLTNETEFKIHQPGDIETMKRGVGFSFDMSLKISRLAGIYYSIHEEAMKRAYYDNIPSIKKAQDLNNKLIEENRELRKSNEEEIAKRTEELTEENIALNSDIETLRSVIEAGDMDIKALENTINENRRKSIQEEAKLRSQILDLKELLHFKKWIKYTVNNIFKHH